MRKLVSFRTITDVQPHPNADTLEILSMDGWKCVVKKGIFTKWQRVVYFEVDSLIPVSEEFEFLRKYCYVNKSWMLNPKEGFRIKTIKLRGELSQGLVILVPESLKGANDDFDLDGYYNVTKYEVPPATLDNNFSGKRSFPEFIPKTGEQRIQNITTKVSKNRDLEYEVTRKYHGMSMTAYVTLKRDLSLGQKLLLTMGNWLGIKVSPVFNTGVCSHNVELSGSNVFSDFSENSGLLDAITEYCRFTGEEIAVQGELCGPGIQNNHHGLEEITFFIFNIYDIRNQRYLLPPERYIVNHFITSRASTLVKEAVIEYYTTIGDRTIEEIIMLGEFDLLSGNPNEGLVWKAMEKDFSFKAISTKFLLWDKS